MNSQISTVATLGPSIFYVSRPQSPTSNAGEFLQGSPTAANPNLFDQLGDAGSQPEPSYEARRSVLDNVDILQQIFEQFDLDELDDNGNSSRKSLVSAALSHTTFLGPSMDALWKTMSSLIPFLKLLPSFREIAGVKMIYGSITPEDWTRFGSYARRTRNFIFSDLAPINEIDQTTFIRLAQHAAGPLFPNLRRISYPCQQLRSTDPLLLLSSSIERIDLTGISSDNHKALVLLSMLSIETPGLKSLNINGTASTLFLQPIMQLKNLCSLSLEALGPIIDNETLQRIGRLEYLTHLSIDFRDSAIDPTFVGFKKLTSLCITAKPPLVNRALEDIESTLLEDLSITTLEMLEPYSDYYYDPPSVPIPPKWALFATVARSRWQGSLRKFSIKHESRISDTIQFSDVFSPLLGIHTLEDFEVKQLKSNINIGFSEYQQMASAWRNLRLLHIRVPHHIPNLSDILKYFSENCRSLTSLELLTNVHNIPSVLPPEFTSFHKLEAISFAELQGGNVLAFARYLDCLFPNLKQVGSGRDSFTEVEKAIKIFQAVRSYERVRMIALWK